MAPKRVERDQTVGRIDKEHRGGVLRLIGNRVAFACIVVVLCLSPFPLGSMNTGFVAAWNLALGLAAICCVPADLSRKQVTFLCAAFACLAAYLVVIHEQISPNPWFFRGLAHPIWQQASAALNDNFTPVVAVVRDLPLIAIGAEFAFVLTLLVSFVLGSERRMGRRLVRVIALAGAVYALLGIVTFAIEPGKILFWKVKTDHIGNLTGTFTNRNTAAVFFGQSAMLWLLFWCEELRDARDRRSLSLYGGLRRLMARPTNRSLIALALLVTTLCAVFMTGSRAGSMLSVVVLAIAFLAYFWRDLVHWKAVASVGGVAAAAVIGLVLIVGGSVGHRFGLQGFDDEARWPVYRATVQIVRDYPELGTGLGSFAAAFQPYRPAVISVSGTWNRAHNVLLEIASDTGAFVAGGVLAWYLVILAAFIWAVARRPTRDPLPVAAALAAWLLAGLHSLVDFSLQIPGYSLTVAALAGTGLARALAPPAPPRTSQAVTATTDSQNGH
jgi:O-Antigen ligase